MSSVTSSWRGTKQLGPGDLVLERLLGGVLLGILPLLGGGAARDAFALHSGKSGEGVSRPTWPLTLYSGGWVTCQEEYSQFYSCKPLTHEHCCSLDHNNCLVMDWIQTFFQSNSELWPVFSAGTIRVNTRATHTCRLQHTLIKELSFFYSSVMYSVYCVQSINHAEWFGFFCNGIQKLNIRFLGTRL